MAFHLNLKDVGDRYKGLETRTQQLCQQWERRSLDLTEIPLFEEQFNINVDIYSLYEDGAPVPRYLSEELYRDNMVLNLHDTHLSYVTNIPAYFQTYHCDSCGRHFDQLSNWKRHQGGCANATEYEFPGGFHKMTPSMELRWLRKHEPVSVSVASNVVGSEEPKCFVNADSEHLIEEMMTYMGSIADSACNSAESNWSSVIEELEALIEKYEAKLGKESKRKNKNKAASTSHKKDNDNGKVLELLSEDEKGV